MLRLVVPLLAISACAGRAAPSAAVEDRWEAWAWQLDGASDAGFLLFAPSDVARELREVVPLTGHVVRRATADDFRRSWPVLDARRAVDEEGVPTVVYEPSVPGDVAFVDLWVELMVAYQDGGAVPPAALRYLESLM